MTSREIAAAECSALPGEPGLERHPSRETTLGALTIWRALPVRDRRLIGPWCFLDRYGPLSFRDERAMDVAPHPHIGLQTVSWLLAGEVLHQDSLGYEAMLRPNGVNIMTAGVGIAHAESTPPRNSGQLDGVQLWVALPDRDRDTAPAFDHVPQVPEISLPGGRALLFAGSLGGAVSPARTYSAMVGADLEIARGETLVCPLDVRFEHGLFLMSGDCAAGGETLTLNTLYSLATGAEQLELCSRGGARVLLLGGPPFPEKILMWWNFVARTPEEIAAARQDWEQQRRFGPVRGYSGPRLEAPPSARFATPNPAS